MSLFYRVMKIDSPARDLVGELYPYNVHGSIVNRLRSLGVSPITAAFRKRDTYTRINNGTVDSLKSLLYNERFSRTNSEEHKLVKLLLKAF